MNTNNNNDNQDINNNQPSIDPKKAERFLFSPSIGKVNGKQVIKKIINFNALDQTAVEPDSEQNNNK